MAMDQTGASTTEPAVSDFVRQWHYRPDVPIRVSPFFSWPPEPFRMLRWVFDRWFTLAENTVLLALSFFCWFFLTPSLDVAKSLALGWIAALYVKNLVLMIIVAGGLHLYFHGWKRQGSRLKFDPRDLKRNSRSFTLGS